MTALSEWLQIMLSEIARKREDLERLSEEEARRSAETVAPRLPSSPPGHS